MGMSAEQFLEENEFLYHVTHRESVGNIRKHGLLSADFAQKCARKPRSYRESYQFVRTTEFDEVYLRDQKPMSPDRLKTVLEPTMTPDAWYELIDHKVFFWVDLESARKLATQYNKKYPQTIFQLKTKKLLDRYRQKTFLSPINSGAIRIPGQGMRGLRTFHLFDQWLINGFTDQKRKGKTNIRELAIEENVVDISKAFRDCCNV